MRTGRLLKELDLLDRVIHAVRGGEGVVDAEDGVEGRNQPWFRRIPRRFKLAMQRSRRTLQLFRPHRLRLLRSGRALRKEWWF